MVGCETVAVYVHWEVALASLVWLHLDTVHFFQITRPPPSYPTSHITVMGRMGREIFNKINLISHPLFFLTTRPTQDLPTLNSKSKAIIDLPLPAFLRNMTVAVTKNKGRSYIRHTSEDSNITDLENVQRVDAVAFLCHG